MFQTSTPVPDAFCGEKPSGDSLSETVFGGAAKGGDALRAIEWRELTARLNAARELRRELRHEAILCAGASGATFGDAAARFLKTVGNGERPVNPDALEGCKASCGNSALLAETAAQGDVRDEL